MKRLVLALTFLVVSAHPIWSDTSESQEFRIIEMEGEAGIIPQGESEASPAKEGISLSEGDRLITGKGGRIQAATQDGTVIELKEASYLKVSKLRPTETSFFLKVGRFLGKFAPKKYTNVITTLKTPIAVAAVRGTELAMDVSEEEELQFGVVEGSVAVTKAEETEESAEAEAVDSPMKNEESEPSVSADEILVESDQGVVVKREGQPERMKELPPLVRQQVAWFAPIREKVPQIKERWRAIPHSQRQELRREAFRERVQWKPPQKFMNQMQSPRERMQRRPGDRRPVEKRHRNGQPNRPPKKSPQ